MATAAQATTTTYDPAKATAGLINSTSTATPGSYSGTGYTADTGTASSYNPTDWSVGANQTVQGQIKSIIDENSPLMQQASTNARQAMNDRGLLNSSMAVGAGQSALYSAALPIAQQDASTYANAGQFNAGAANAASQYNASNKQTMDLSNMQATNAASEFTTNAANQANAQNASNTQQANLANAAAQNATNQTNANNTQQTNLANQSATNTASQFNAQQTNAQTQFNASESNEILKTTLDQENKLALAGIEADYKTLMQANQSVSDMYQMTVRSIESIQSNKDITADTKTTYIANQLSYLKTYAALTEKLNNLSGLDELLTFK